jgi:hypothetical protein
MKPDEMMESKMDTLYQVTINAHCPETKEAFDRWWKAKEEYHTALGELNRSVEKCEPVKTTKRTTPYSIIDSVKPEGNPNYPKLDVVMRATVRQQQQPTAAVHDPYLSIQFKNLNDLNAAKFLSDEEKRRILGLPRLAEQVAKINADDKSAT